MLISTLAQSTNPLAWGVEIDEDIFDPPAHIRTIGLLWEGDAPDAISDRLIDTIIAFNLAGAEVILELRPTDDVDHTYLLTLAGNAGFSVAAVPPKDQTELEAWCRQCAGLARALLTVPNFSGDLFPVTGYISYLTLELFAGAEAMAPTDPYTILRFTSQTPTNWSDAAKAEMRAEMSQMLGGEEGLRDYIGAILKAIQAETKSQLIDMLRDRKSA